MIKFSQVFLKDISMREKIADLVCSMADFSKDNALIEIGPGQGAITSLVFPRVPSMKAVEIDSQLASLLSKKYPSLDLINSDFLSINLSLILPKTKKIFFFGNLPYKISTAIMEKVLDTAGFGGAVFMFQKEVADRLCANPGSRDYGYFSAVCSFQTKIEQVLFVPRGCFTPVPKVDSAVVMVKPLENVPNISLIKGMRKVASFCFAHRRKTIANSFFLSSGGKLSREEISDIMSKSGIDPQLRAEKLSANDFYILAEAFKQRLEIFQ